MLDRLLRSRSCLRIGAVLLTAFLIFAPLTAAAAEADDSAVTEEGVSEETETAESGESTESAERQYASEKKIKTNGIEGWPKAYNTYCDYVCLMDADTGTVLLAKKMYKKTPPASLTKGMTALLALENGNLDDQVTMTQTGVDYACDGSSNLFTQVGETFILRDMLYGVMLKSANDMATQVGEYIGGSLDTFLEMMNARAAEIGCTRTNFANACGMPNEEHLSCARDMALIYSEAIQNEQFREIISTAQYTIPASNMTDARTVENHHPFVVSPNYYYEGTIGGKTGYTDLAGNCLVTAAERDGMTLVAVTMHGNGIGQCLADTREVLDYGFDNFAHVSTEDLPEDLVSGGTLTLPKGAAVSDCTAEQTTETAADGTAVIRTVYSYNGQTVGDAVMTQETADRIAAEAKAAEEAERAEAEAAAAAAESEHDPTELHLEFDESEAEEAESLGGNDLKEALDSSETIALPFGMVVPMPVFIAMCGLFGLILLGLLLIILTMLRQMRKKR